MAKWLMDENQQSSVTQELGRLELLRAGTGESSASATDTNNNSFATRSITKRTVEEIWGSKATSKKPLKCMSHKTTSGKTPGNFAILSRVKPSDFRFVTCFMPFLKFDLPRL